MRLYIEIDKKHKENKGKNMEIGFFLIKAQRYFEKRDNFYKHVF